jgi:hypothetical protein
MLRNILCTIIISFTAKCQDLAWKKTFSFQNKETVANGVAIDPAGNVFVIGSQGDGFVLYIDKFTSSGQLLWQDTIMSGSENTSGGIVADRQGNVYASLYSLNSNIFFKDTSFYGHTNYLAKYSSNGDLKWVTWAQYNQRPINSAIDKADFIYTIPGGKFDGTGNCKFSLWDGYDIAVDDLGNYFYSIYGPLSINKYDSLNNQIWSFSVFAEVAITADSIGNCYVSSVGEHGISSIIKLTPTGGVAWSFTLPIVGARAITMDAQGSIYVAGMAVTNDSYAGIGVYKFNAAGQFIWHYLIPNYDNMVYSPTDIAAENGAVYISGYHEGGDLITSGYLFKIDESLHTGISAYNEIVQNLTLSPNPCSSLFNLQYSGAAKGNLSVRVCDPRGVCIYEEIESNFNGRLSKTIDLHCAPGIYLVQVSGNGYSATRKLVVN